MAWIQGLQAEKEDRAKAEEARGALAEEASEAPMEGVTMETAPPARSSSVVLLSEGDGE